MPERWLELSNNIKRQFRIDRSQAFDHHPILFGTAGSESDFNVQIVGQAHGFVSPFSKARHTSKACTAKKRSKQD